MRSAIKWAITKTTKSFGSVQVADDYGAIVA